MQRHRTSTTDATLAEGEVYEVEPWIFGGTDTRTRRHVVIAHVTAPPAGVVTVFARTLNINAVGAHTGAPCDGVRGEPGVYAYRRSADYETFLAHSDRLGVVDDTVLDQIRAMFRGDE